MNSSSPPATVGRPSTTRNCVKHAAFTHGEHCRATVEVCEGATHSLLAFMVNACWTVSPVTMPPGAWLLETAEAAHPQDIENFFWNLGSGEIDANCSDSYRVLWTLQQRRKWSAPAAICFLIGFTKKATRLCLSGKQNQCWSVSQATSTCTSEELELLL